MWDITTPPLVNASNKGTNCNFEFYRSALSQRASFGPDNDGPLCTQNATHRSHVLQCHRPTQGEREAPVCLRPPFPRRASAAHTPRVPGGPLGYLELAVPVRGSESKFLSRGRRHSRIAVTPLRRGVAQCQTQGRRYNLTVLSDIRVTNSPFSSRVRKVIGA